MSLKQAFLALGVLVLGLGATSAEACRKVRTKSCCKPAPACGYVTVGYRLYNVDSCGRVCNVRDYYYPGYGPTTAPSATSPAAPEAPAAPAPASSTSRLDSDDQTDLLQSAPRRGTRNDPNANLRFRSAPRP
jgi:hypothetical protein